MTIEAASASRSTAALWPATQRADSFSSKRPPPPVLLALWPRPDLGVGKTDDRLALDIDGNHRMDKEAGRLAVAGRPQTAPLLVTPGEIDLAGILDGKDAPATTLLRRARRQRCHDRLGRNVSRRQEPVRRHLAGPGLANFAQHDTPHRRDPLNQPVRPFRNPDVAKCHQSPLATQFGTLNHSQPPSARFTSTERRITFVNAVALEAGQNRQREAAPVLGRGQTAS